MILIERFLIYAPEFLIITGFLIFFNLFLYDKQKYCSFIYKSIIILVFFISLFLFFYMTQGINTINFIKINKFDILIFLFVILISLNVTKEIKNNELIWLSFLGAFYLSFYNSLIIKILSFFIINIGFSVNYIKEKNIIKEKYIWLFIIFIFSVILRTFDLVLNAKLFIIIFNIILITIFINMTSFDFIVKKIKNFIDIKDKLLPLTLTIMIESYIFISIFYMYKEFVAFELYLIVIFFGILSSVLNSLKEDNFIKFLIFEIINTIYLTFTIIVISFYNQKIIIIFHTLLFFVIYLIYIVILDEKFIKKTVTTIRYNIFKFETYQILVIFIIFTILFSQIYIITKSFSFTKADSLLRSMVVFIYFIASISVLNKFFILTSMLNKFKLTPNTFLNFDNLKIINFLIFLFSLIKNI